MNEDVLFFFINLIGFVVLKGMNTNCCCCCSCCTRTRFHFLHKILLCFIFQKFLIILWRDLFTLLIGQWTKCINSGNKCVAFGFILYFTHAFRQMELWYKVVVQMQETSIYLYADYFKKTQAQDIVWERFHLVKYIDFTEDTETYVQKHFHSVLNRPKTRDLSQKKNTYNVQRINNISIQY